MAKKLFITSIIVCLMLLLNISTINAATMTNTIKDSSNKASSMMQNAESHIENGVNNIKNGAMNVGNTIMGGTENMTNKDTTGATTNNDEGYVATRTAFDNDPNIMGMSSTTWTWLILAAVTIAIVALVWYYGAQYEHRSNYNNE